MTLKCFSLWDGIRTCSTVYLSLWNGIRTCSTVYLSLYKHYCTTSLTDNIYETTTVYIYSEFVHNSLHPRPRGWGRVKKSLG